MNARYALLADSATLSMDGKVSIIGIFKNISANKFPINHASMTLVFELEADINEVGSHKVAIELRNWDGKVLNSVEMPNIIVGKASDPGPVYTAGIQVVLQNTPFAAAGMYEIVILCDDEYLTSVDFSVQKVNLRRRR